MNKEQKVLGEGHVVGHRYQVERFLGAGAIGTAYSCQDLIGGGTRVVVRILRSAATAAEHSTISSRDFTLLRRLSHPNLVRITDAGIVESSNGLFLVRDWIQGKNIYAATDGMDAEAILSVVMELTKALQYLHTRGIVHGHLSPFNAMVCGDEEGTDRLKLMDFGLSRNLSNGQRNGDIGRLAYAAPEVLLGGAATGRSDMYSLGILTYQLLTRRLPFEDEDPEFLIQKHLQSSVDLRPIERMRGGNRVSPLVESLLEKDPARRPSSGEEVIRLIIDAMGRHWLNTDIKEMESHFCASQFVGREKEMSHVQESAQRVRENGRGWTIFITGEAGSGKTRCMEELKSWALLEGWQVAEGSCEAREAGAYAPYRQILASHEPAEGETLFRFQDTPRTPTPEIYDASPEYAAGQYRDLLTRELIRRMKKQPTLLLLHDFHLADEATSTVLDYLSSDIQSHSVLMCVSLRSGEEIKGAMGRVLDSVTRQERGESIALEPLEKENVEKLIEGMTGDGRLKSTLGDWIFKSVGGNPFFLEEMLKHLVERRFLCREFGRWRFIEEDLEKLEVPASVGAVLLRRLELLSPPARELANWLALFQGNVPRFLLSSVTAQNPTLTAEGLQELSYRQMIDVEMKRAEEKVGFVHSLIAEVIQTDLQKPLRRKMHRKIAETLEREVGVEGHVQELAMHYMEGNAGDIAVRFAWDAALQARSEFAHEKALRCFEYIFKHRSGLTNTEICAAAIEASDTMFALGLPKQSIRLLRTEISKSKTVSPELKARMYMQLALSYQHMGDLSMQESCCKKGLTFFRNRPAGEVNLTKAMLWAELAFAAILRSRSRRGLVFLDKARKSCPSENAAALKGRIESLTSAMHRIACNLREAHSASEKATAILSLSGESYLACSAYSALGGILAGIGRFPLALEKHAQAVTLSDKSRSVVLRSQALGNLAECLCRMGRTQEAMLTAERASKSVCEANSPAISYAFNAILAETKLAAGNYRGACEIVEELNRNARQNQAIYTKGHVLYVAAYLNFVLGRFDSALDYVEKLCTVENHETPFYERELAEAVRARIFFELGNTSKALTILFNLEKKAARKHWPYQLCVMKLYIGDILIKQCRLEQAERYAKSALKLAKPMQAVSLMAYSHLLLGLIYSPLRRIDDPIHRACERLTHISADSSTIKAIEELREACKVVEFSYHTETLWRANSELSQILKLLPAEGNYMDHARKAHEVLCKAEDQVPSEMLPAYWAAFNRSRRKSELAYLIESGGEQECGTGVAIAEIRDEDKARILLRMSTTVGTIRELNPLLEAILDQLIQAIKVERAFIFLKDELTGGLRLAKGRNDQRQSITYERDLDRYILNDVFKKGSPIVSANAHGDPRFLNKDREITDKSGKLLCAPLKLS
ncbi:MAG TPA: protein kinase, partial [Acidobacteriota bacterium]|nr:protein kinase [Acidobacteriota bacterium]